MSSLTLSPSLAIALLRNASIALAPSTNFRKSAPPQKSSGRSFSSRRKSASLNPAPSAITRRWEICLRLAALVAFFFESAARNFSGLNERGVLRNLFIGSFSE